MKYYLRLTFLISQLIRDEKKQKRAIKLAINTANNDSSILELLKKEGYLTTGVTEADMDCEKTEDAEQIDDLIYNYFKYKENHLAFCTILKEQLRVYKGDKKKAIQATIDICINEGNLVKYLSEHRREVEDYMFALLSDEELKQAYGDYRESLGVEQERLSNIRKLMNKNNLSAEEAMEMLDVPKDKWTQYIELLK